MFSGCAGVQMTKIHTGFIAVRSYDHIPCFLLIVKEVQIFPRALKAPRTPGALPPALTGAESAWGLGAEAGALVPAHGPLSSPTL